MNIYSIYKATNIVTGKSYIGFTSNFKKRKKEHLNSKRKDKFHNSIRKNGGDLFTWEILYQSYDLRHTLDIMEPLYILIYDSYLNGYNSSLGGEGVIGYKMTDKQKQKLSVINIGKVLSEKTKNKISKKLFGTKRSKETIEKMSKIRQNISKPSVSMDKNGQAKTFKFISPKGEEFIVKGQFKKFCLEHGLSRSTMQKICKFGKILNRGRCIGWLVYLI